MNKGVSFLETGIHNTSEIGRLKKVLLHRPGGELENLMPEYLERLLFDDIPYLKEAQREHDAFADCSGSKEWRWSTCEIWWRSPSRTRRAGRLDPPVPGGVRRQGRPAPGEPGGLPLCLPDKEMVSAMMRAPQVQLRATAPGWGTISLAGRG